MAVTNADIAGLQRQMSSLQDQLRAKSGEIDRAAARIKADNQKKLDELKESTRREMSNRESRLKEKYQNILDKHESDTQAQLMREYRALEAQYENLRRQLNRELAYQQKLTEESLIQQKQFEQAYYERESYARSRAEDSRKEAAQELKSTLGETPLEWFLPGHTDRYINSLRDIDGFMNASLYESAIGISENLILSIRLDRETAEDQFRKWFGNYFNFIHALNMVNELLFNSFLSVPEQFGFFRYMQRNSIQNGRMDDNCVRYWSDGEYERFLDKYEETMKGAAAHFLIEGEAMTDEKKIRRYMIENPANASELGELFLYKTAMNVISMLGDIQQSISHMHDKIRAYDERMTLARSVKDTLEAEGYELVKNENFFKAAEPFSVKFADSMNANQIQLILVPVLRRSDNRWVNLAVWFYSEDMPEEQCYEIEHMLADVLVTKEIGVQRMQMKIEQTDEERVRIAFTEMQMKVNGRLN